MLTVVHVITRLELGGAQQNTLSTCRALAARGHRVVLAFGPGGPLDSEVEDLARCGVEIEPIPSLVRPIRPGGDGAAAVRLRRLFAARRREHRGASAGFIVHTHSSKAGIVGRAAAASTGVESVVHSIHGFAFHAGQPAALFGAYVRAERALSRVTRAFIAVSRANVAEAQARGIIRPHHRVEVIRSGMELDAFFAAADARPEARRELEVNPETPLFVSISNLKPQKDPLTLVDAMKRVVAERPTAELWYAGDGPLRASVEQRVGASGLQAHFRLLGWRRDVPRLLAAADVAVLSSRFEGLPRSAVQAVASRRPFVGTRVDGTPELIRVGREGYLVEPAQPAALAAAMLRALDEPPTMPHPATRLASWSTTELVSRQEALYEELASAS